MGHISFATPRPDALPPQTVERCYFAGMEGIPWSSFNDADANILSIEREMSDSGGLYIPWQLNGAGELVLSTASLIERDEPYQLDVEVARGTLNRLRNYAEVGRMLQYQVSPESANLMAAATESMVEAVIGADQIARAQAANRVIDQASQAIRRCCVEFGRQLIAQRQRQNPLSTLYGVRIDQTVLAAGNQENVLPACNAAALTFDWGGMSPNAGDYEWASVDSQLRFCREKGLKTFGGPLLKFERAVLPDWVYLWEDDFDNLRSFALEFVDKSVRRYQGQVDVWYVSAGLNSSRAIRLSEEQRLRLTMDSLEAARLADPRTPVVVSFSQPWAESMAVQDSELSPIHFADYLVRSGVGLAAVGLEINWGFWPGGTLCRDLLEISYHLDRWSMLGLPIIVFLTLPASAGPDEQATSNAQVTDNHPGLVGDDKYYEDLLTVLLAKPAVQGIIYNQASDSVAHEFPHAGLFDPADQPRPVLRTLSSVRRSFQLT